MNSKIAHLIKEIKFGSEKSRRNAITDIGLLLEMNAWNLTEKEKLNKYEGMVDSDLIYLCLNESEIDEIVACLQEAIISKNQDSVSLISIIRCTSAKSGLSSLIIAIEHCIYNFNADELNQALLALEKLLFFEDTLSPFQKRAMLLEHVNLLNQLSHKILSEIPISNNDLTSTYVRIVSRLMILLFDEDYFDDSHVQ
jgi:hypothetical protein